MNRQIADEAADWFIDINAPEVTAAQKRAFDGWLRQSPEHVQAYMELLAIWEEGAYPLRGDGESIDAVVASARKSENIVDFPGSDVAALDRPQGQGRAWRFVAVTALLFCGSGLWMWRAAATHYSTAIGEKRLINLSDGSSVELNTHSRISVNFNEHERVVVLTAGEALFRVAKDNTRPFVVDVDHTRVRAIGTQFDVYKQAGVTTVTVLEGRVAVAPLGMPSRPSPVFLSAGEQLSVTPVLEKQVQPARANATAWTQDRLIFDTTPLPEVAREFNRYNTRQMQVDDASLQDFLISGSFSSTDAASLVRFLRSQDELLVHETSDAIHVSRR